MQHQSVKYKVYYNRNSLLVTDFNCGFDKLRYKSNIIFIANLKYSIA